MYSHTNAHCFYLIFGLPLLWHTKMKATKVLLYNKHHRKKKRVNCTFIEEYTAKRATVFFPFNGFKLHTALFSYSIHEQRKSCYNH